MPPALSTAVSSLPRVPCVRLWARACVQTRVRMWEESHIHPGPSVTAERETDKGLCSSSLSSAESEATAPSLPSSEGRPAAESHLLTDSPLITTPAQVDSMQGRPGFDFPSERQPSYFKETRDPEYGTLCSRSSQ